MPSVTYRTIAQHAGVSVTTVSLAMRESPLITKETRDRVQASARKLGYQPNPLVAALMSSLGNRKRKSIKAIIGVVSLNSQAARSRVHPGARRIHETAADHAAAYGYQIEEIVLESIEAAGRDLNQILHARHITALLLDDGADLPARMSVDWSRYSVVRAGSRMGQHRFHTVTADHYAVMDEAITQVLARGYRRVGVFLPRWIRDVSNDQFAAACAHRRHVLGEKRLVSLLFTEDVAGRSVLDWVRRESLDAVITPDHRVLMWLREEGIKVPEQVAVAHTHTVDPWWPFSGIYQDDATMVRHAVDLLIAECNHNHRGPPEHPVWVGLRGSWRDGETMRPLPPA